MNNKGRFILQITCLILMISGYWILWSNAGTMVAVSVFMIHFSINIERRIQVSKWLGEDL